MCSRPGHIRRIGCTCTQAELTGWHQKLWRQHATLFIDCRCGYPMFCPFQSKLRIKMSRSISPLVCLFAALVSPSATSSEFSWPLEVKTHTQCVFKVPGMAMSGMNCVQDVQAIAELPAPYRQLATQLSELSATSKPEDFSVLLGVQPRRVGRVHSFRTAQKEMRT